MFVNYFNCKTVTHQRKSTKNRFFNYFITNNYCAWCRKPLNISFDKVIVFLLGALFLVAYCMYGTYWGEESESSSLDVYRWNIFMRLGLIKINFSGFIKISEPETLLKFPSVLIINKTLFGVFNWSPCFGANYIGLLFVTPINHVPKLIDNDYLPTVLLDVFLLNF